MIFHLSFFDSIEHLPIYLLFEAKVMFDIDGCIHSGGYMCILIKFLLSFFLISNIHLIPCKYLFNFKKKLKTMSILRLRYTGLIYYWRYLNIYLVIFWASLEKSNQLCFKTWWWWESVFKCEFINIFPSQMTFIKKHNNGKILDKNQI